MKIVNILAALALVTSGANASFRPQQHASTSTKTSTKTSAKKLIHSKDQPPAFLSNIPRCGVNTGDAIPETAECAKNIIVECLEGLQKFMGGAKSDTLQLLGVTALNYPMAAALKISPIIGFLALGVLFGPSGRNWIADVHTTEMMADIGIVFFLFEMGIHLSFNTLMRMRKTVFGLGGAQFGITALTVALIAIFGFGLSAEAATVLGGGLALSSSAFVLQLLKDKNMLETEYGKSSFGILLLQDLMVVPLLVIMPILAGTGGSLGQALGKAGTQLAIALSAILAMGKYVLGPAYNKCIAAGSQEGVIGLTVLTVLGFSYLTEGLGLSNTLGAFLAGVLLAENPHVHRIEQEASPIRGILVGLFFFTVGFEIDLKLISSKFPLIASLVVGLLALKGFIAQRAATYFGLESSAATRLGLVLSQGGEFGFVAFRAAREYGIFNADLTKLMLTVVALTMAATPSLEDLGASIMANKGKHIAGQMQKEL